MEAQNFSAERSTSPKCLNILLVDDEQNIREALCEYLGAINSHQVTTAASGGEALELFASGKFDVAFLDLKMPGMSGMELLRRLKQQDPVLPVVIMTGYPSLDAAIDTMRHGAADFLIKPFNLQQVKVTLERVVREQQLLRENLRLSEQLAQKREIEKLNQELNRRIDQQNTLRHISESIDLFQTSEDAYQGMAELAAKYLGVRRSAVLLLDRGSNQLLIIAVHGYPAEVLGQTAGTAGTGVVGKVASEGVPMMGTPGMEPALEALLPVERNYFCLPIKIRNEVFGVLLAADKEDQAGFKGEDIFIARFLLDKAALNIENIALYESMVTNLHSTLGALVGAMEAKDPYTRRHSRRVTTLSVLTAQNMGLGLAEIESTRFAAYLHDIGKIGIKDYILQKPTKLNEDEYRHIKKHPIIGESIVKDMDLSDSERAIIRHHHERWDGKGYPDGLGGTDIPQLARIVAVADAFDAMSSDRPYRKGKRYDDAVAELSRCSGSQFDPVVVEAFVEMLSRYQNLNEIPMARGRK